MTWQSLIQALIQALPILLSTEPYLVYCLCANEQQKDPSLSSLRDLKGQEAQKETAEKQLRRRTKHLTKSRNFFK